MIARGSGGGGGWGSSDGDFLHKFSKAGGAIAGSEISIDLQRTVSTGTDGSCGFRVKPDGAATHEVLRR